MKINGKALAQTIIDHLKDDVAEGLEKGWNPPKLVVFTVNPTTEVKAFMRAKENKVNEIGGEFELKKFTKEPKFMNFAHEIDKLAHEPETNGIIVQHPLPPALSTSTLLDYIPLEKEIEGIKKKAPFDPPIGLAVLSMLKTVYSPEDMTKAENVIVDIERDANLFKNIFKRKRVVLIGRGMTGGAPVGKALTEAKINYINLNSQTQSSDTFIPIADVIISAVGKQIIDPEQVKKGSTLISVGLHKTRNGWQGDYDEDAIKDKVLAYSPTPGGVGPLNVAYLLYNLVQAWKYQYDPPKDAKKKKRSKRRPKTIAQRLREEKKRKKQKKSVAHDTK